MSNIRFKPSVNRWYILAVLFVVYVFNQVDRQIMGILLEPIKRDMGASDTQMGFLVGITFALFYASMGIPIALLADRSNRRNIVSIALASWSIMTVACGYAQTFVQLTLARIGVGIGEAGSNPPSQSMISDLFPASERGTALSIYATGVNVGVMVAFLAGGVLSQYFGWRATFIIVGIPGILIALLVRFTVVEPVRGASDTQPADDQSPSASEVMRTMFGTPALRHVVLGASVAAFVGYGMVIWLPAFLVRSHGLSQSEIGVTLALLTGVVGGMGTFISGRICDKLAARDIRWTPWVVAIAKASTVPFTVAFFAFTDFTSALAAYLIPAFIGGFYLGPSYAMIQTLVPPRMRAVAAAISLFMMNIIGLGLGPQLVGITSDLLIPIFDDQSLRYALMACSCLNLWAAAHYYMASRSLAAAYEGVGILIPRSVKVEA